MADPSTNPLSDSVLGGRTMGSLASWDSLGPRPSVIGPYRILDLLGEGGMGEVFKAERDQPIRQTVAIKVVKLGMNSREIVGRFESERQALALMDHPGIARVLDAGTTPTGRPFFVMDYVAGKPITTFCDENRLTISDRLRLFADVCDAIAHAHTKAIIHRDIKPSNVLAYFQDGTPAVKVIDFGIAKALTTDRLTDLTFNTVQGRAIGTYDCMSPEQVEGSADIDTRTDVYSLGVLLYELLIGAKPFDRAASGTTDDEMSRIIREVEPPRPSTRLTGLGKNGALIAEQRQARLDALTRQLRGELEWIPLKAMRKDRARRYASPMQLKEDIENYLAGRALLAGPESRAYRIRKYVIRNRRVLGTAAAIVSLLIGTASYYVYSLRAEQMKTRAEERKTKAALVESEQQRAEAQRQAAVARDSSNFLASIFRNADPKKSLGAEVTVVQALQNAIRTLEDGNTQVQPLTEATVRYITGTTFRSLGRYEEALPQLRRACELDAKYRAADDPQTPVTLADLGTLLMDLGKVAEAEVLFRRVQSIYEAASPEYDSELARILSHLALVVKEQGKVDEAEELSLRALEMRRKILPAGDPDIATSLNNLAKLYWNQGKLDQAEPLVRETLRMRQASLPAGHPNIAQSILNLSVLLRDQKKLREAESFARQALQMRRAILPSEHPDLAVATDNLGRILQGRSAFAESEALFRETLSIRRAALPAGDPRTADSMVRLATIISEQGRDVEAEPLLREALELQRARDAKAAPTTQTAGKLADLLQRTDRSSGAAELRSAFGITAPTTRATSN